MPKPFVSGPSDFRPPPYSFENLTSITFVLKSNDINLLAHICDEFLNAPLNRTAAQSFVPYNDQVMLTFSSFPDAESEVNPVVGSLTYQEVSLVFAVYDNKNDQASWYPALLFLDGPQTGTAEYFATPPILLGRELFGLPKIRGEIDFQPDLTGTLRCTFPTPQNVLMNLGDCIKVSLKGQILLAKVMDDLGDIEDFLIKHPSDTRANKRKLDLLKERKKINRELTKIRHGGIFGKRLHPFEVVNRIWGDNVRRFVKNIDRKIIEALDKVKGSFTDAELEEAVALGMSTGFFKKLSMSDVMIGGPLMGLRQIHSPTNFLDADHQVLIVAPFDYDTYPNYAANGYTVEFFSAEMRDWLGLDPTYDIPTSEGLGFDGASAMYGDPAKTFTVTS